MAGLAQNGQDSLRSGPSPALAQKAVRADFPLLETGVAYLDSAATSQKPTAVLDALDSYYRRSNANVHRGVYKLAQDATDLFEGARERIAAFVGGETGHDDLHPQRDRGDQPRRLLMGPAPRRPGDEVVLTHMEHHSNIVPWQMLCQETGATLRYLGVSEDGRLSLDELDEVLAGGKVKLVAVAHVSNVLGTINPVAEIAARARAAGAITLVDGSQAVPQMPVDLPTIGADFYAWTGHKALGPTGIGVLHGRRELLEEMRSVPRRRRHDLLGRLRFLDLQRAAVEVRGRHLRRSPRRSGSARPSTTSPGSGSTTCAHTSAS